MAYIVAVETVSLYEVGVFLAPILMTTSRFTARVALSAAAATTLLLGTAAAGPIIIPNGSFEAPSIPVGIPASPTIDLWQKPAEPVGYVPINSPYGPLAWFQTSGAFPNTPVGAGDHIDNVDGSQVAYVFAYPGAGLLQDLSAQYAVGQSYTFTLGVLGGQFLESVPGAKLQLGLYYRGTSNEIIQFKSFDILYSAGAFPIANHFYDFSVSSLVVQAGDAWAGKNIGVQIISTAPGGSYWDVENARLQAVPEPAAASLLLAGGVWLAARRGRRAMAK